MFKQKAHGEVTVKVVPGTPHCGIDAKEVTMKYNIELQFGESALDQDGFLLDNTAFRGYFAAMSTLPVCVSCENLARKIAIDLGEMVGPNRDLRGVSVCLSPFEGVAVEFHKMRCAAVAA